MPRRAAEFAIAGLIGALVALMVERSGKFPNVAEAVLSVGALMKEYKEDELPAEGQEIDAARADTKLLRAMLRP
jgi:hypothetical protein